MSKRTRSPSLDEKSGEELSSLESSPKRPHTKAVSQQAQAFPLAGVIIPCERSGDQFGHGQAEIDQLVLPRLPAVDRLAFALSCALANATAMSEALRSDYRYDRSLLTALGFGVHVKPWSRLMHTVLRDPDFRPENITIGPDYVAFGLLLAGRVAAAVTKAREYYVLDFRQRCKPGSQKVPTMSDDDVLRYLHKAYPYRLSGALLLLAPTELIKDMHQLVGDDLFRCASKLHIPMFTRTRLDVLKLLPVPSIADYLTKALREHCDHPRVFREPCDAAVSALAASMREHHSDPRLFQEASFEDDILMPMIWLARVDWLEALNAPATPGLVSEWFATSDHKGFMLLKEELERDSLLIFAYFCSYPFHLSWSERHSIVSSLGKKQDFAWFKIYLERARPSLTATHLATSEFDVEWVHVMLRNNWPEGVRSLAEYLGPTRFFFPGSALVVAKDIGPATFHDVLHLYEEFKSAGSRTTEIPWDKIPGTRLDLYDSL
jgi:hypothetical protein